MIRTVLFACALAVAAEVATGAAIEPGAAEHGSTAAALDKSVDPLQDFFMYVNGNFIRENPIPPAYSSWGQVQTAQ